MAASAQGLRDWVIASWKSDSASLPAFPVVASRLVDAREQPSAEVAHVSELLAQDPAITSHVIRTANSAFYGGVTPISDVQGAIMRLGFRETANVAMCAACGSLFAVEDRAELEVFPEVWGQLWSSALVGAYGARLIASELKVGDPAAVFLAALFRDVGSLLVLKLVASGLVHGRLRHGPDEAQLEALFADLHERLGGLYLRQSQLPEATIRVAEAHHSLDVELSADSVGQHVVRVADGLCDRLEVAPFSSGRPGPAAEHSIALLDLDEERLDYFTLQLEGIREQLQDLMS